MPSSLSRHFVIERVNFRGELLCFNVLSTPRNQRAALDGEAARTDGVIGEIRMFAAVARANAVTTLGKGGRGCRARTSSKTFAYKPG